VRSGGGPPLVERLLRAPGVAALARVLLTAAFWTSGVAKLLDFPGDGGRSRLGPARAPRWSRR
jgi:uncharacterized membrane protein YphA (DoxX/SURF4 family)